jgi:hypothetical protein
MVVSALMEPEVSLPFPKLAAIGFHRKPNASNPRLGSQFL